METKFFNFSQNNSGGYFITDDAVELCEEIIVEATNAKEAWEKLSSIIDSSSQNAWSSCSCCGDRRSSWVDDEDGTENPIVYGVPVEQAMRQMFTAKVYVHYSDGTFKSFLLKESA